MKYYVLKYPNGSLVGIDQNSGGYPFEAWRPSEPEWSMSSVKMWTFTDHGRKDAVAYLNTFKNSSDNRWHFKLAFIEVKITDTLI